MIPVALLLAMTLLPLLFGVIGGLYSALDPAAWQQLLAAPGLWTSLALSLRTGVAAAVLALLLAHALLACSVGTRWLQRLRRLSLPFLALPHLAMAIGVALVLAPSGLLLRLLSPWLTGFLQPPDWATIQDRWGIALTLGLLLKETPFLLLALSAAMNQVPCERLMLQARTLGYGRLKAWAVAVAPLLQKQIGLAFCAVVVFGIGNVDVAIALAPTTPPPLSMLLWQWFTDPDLSQRPLAAAGSVLLLAVTLLLLLVGTLAMQWLARHWRRTSNFVGDGRRAVGDAGARRALAAIAIAMGTLGVLAISALALRAQSGAWRFPSVLPTATGRTSLADSTAGTWISPALHHAAASTITIATLTVALALVACVAAAEALRDAPARRARLGSLLFLPLLLPQFSFLYGLQILFAGLRLDGTLLAVVWSHLLFVLPYVYGVIGPARAAQDSRLIAAARTLGASPAAAFMRVTLPLLLPAALLAAALAFSVSAAVYLPTLFAGAGRIATLATDAAATLTAGDLRSAARSALLQAALPFAVFGLAFAVQRGRYCRRSGVPR